MAYQLSFEAIGTAWVIDILDSLSVDRERDITRAIHARIETFDKAYSRFREDSLVTHMAQRRGIYTLPSDVAPMMALYRELYQLTKGTMTPLIGNTLSDAGYDATYSLRSRPLTTPPSWDDSLSYVEPTLTIKQPVLLDFGAMGKGYLVDLVGQLLEEHDIHSYCVDAGGDILYKSNDAQKLRVGLENPNDFTQVIGVAQIRNQSICGSSGNRRKWGSYHHIINPQTLTSPDHIQACWVVAPTALLADALTTALFFISPLVLEKYYSFSYLLVFPDFSVEKSADFPADLYYS